MPTVSLGERQSGQRRGGKPAHKSPGAATAGRLGSEGITPPRLPAPSSPSPSPFPRRRAGARAAPLAPRSPGPARFPPTAGARPRGPALELCREEKLGCESGGRESEARGGAGRGCRRSRARGRGAQVGARGRVGAQAAAGRQVPRARRPRGAGRSARPLGRAAGRPGRGRPPLCGSGRASPFSPARGCLLLRGAGRGGAGDGDEGAEALPPPARPAVSRGGRVLPDPSSGRTEVEGAEGAGGLRYQRVIISEPPQT